MTSANQPSNAFDELLHVMARLRRDCLWTAEQTHQSLARYVLEEAHETYEAIVAGDDDEIRDELGDVLLQVVFHAAIAAEDNRFTIDDVAASIAAKLKHRNPHVFGDEKVSSVAEIDANWQRLKAAQKPRESIVEGIPNELPALLYATKVLGKTADQPTAGNQSIGAQLLGLVAQARAQGVDPEAALKQAAREHAERHND